MNDSFPPRPWRQDRGALFAGVCAGLAEDLDLPLPLIRMVAVLFVVLPTGIAYLALSLLLRRRPAGMRWEPHRAGASGRARPSRGETARQMPMGQNWALLRHRFEMLEPRLGRIEAFVTSSDFELHRGFRRMGD